MKCNSIKLKVLAPLSFFLTFLQSIYGQNETKKLSVPLGGNSWVTVRATDSREEVTDTGWINWQNKKTVFSTYVYLAKAGTLKLSVSPGVPNGKSTILCSINGNSKTFNVSGTAKEYEIGEWKITQPGYLKIDMQGMNKTGEVFAVINELFMAGSAVDERTAYVKNDEGNYFYWGRRGPSVHLNYDLPDTNDDIEWFYNEVTVPQGNDVVGSFFMADGFAHGYFGFQVNSPTERRVLFSVWSPFTTDDPKNIPDDKKIILLKKGNDVYAGEFGNEGSGGQSYLKYNWKAGETYKFLLHAKPAANNYMVYTAYFYATEQKKWLLIASFSRPFTATYLTRLHSFLENFDPEKGYIARKALYHNQWIRTKEGKWKPLNKMKFTGDATAQKGYRLDYSGGDEKEGFFLRNCGFFNNNTKLKSTFSHRTLTKAPGIDLFALE